MDDWNDFGTTPSAQPPARDPHSDSSRSTLDATSDASVSILGTSRSSSSSSYSAPRTPSAHSAVPVPNTSSSRENAHSFLSNLPFLGSRKAERQAAAATAAANAAAALADGSIVDNTIVPVSRSTMADRDRRVDDNDGVSMASESDDAHEPRSVYMSRNVGNTRVADEHNVFGVEQLDDEEQEVVRRGELDDVPDDYELNVEGFRFTAVRDLHTLDDLEEGQSSVIASSLLRTVEKSYTKLEVISAKQIKNLILFFNVFVFLSIAITVIGVVLSNTKYRKLVDPPIPEPLLHDDQLEGLRWPVPLDCPPTCPTVSRSYSFMKMSTARQAMFPAPFVELTARDLAARGMYVTRTGIVYGPVVPLSSTRVVSVTSLSHAWSEENESQLRSHKMLTVPTTGRDGDSLESGQDTEAGPESGHRKRTLPPAFKLPLGRYVHPVRQDGGSQDSDEDADSDSGSESGTDTESKPTQTPPPPFKIPPGRYVYARKINITTTVFPQAYQRATHTVTLVLSILFLALWVLFALRLLRQGRKNISHEQVWVLILIFVASFYFNTIAGVVRLIELSREASDESDFPKWFTKWDKANTVLRDISFTTFSYFYLWVSLHSYRILNPTQSLEWRFYLPKLIILLPYALYKALAFLLIEMYLSEVPMLSGPALAFYFSGFKIWGYLKAELLYCIGATVMELLLTSIIIYEAVKTTRVLEKAPYMKHRTKRVGFRFFLYFNFMFYPLFITLHVLLVFARPKGENIIQVISGINVPRADPIWYNTMGPAVLVTGYVLVTAYVHLPYTSLGVIKGWLWSSELAESGSRWTFSSADSDSTQHTTMTGLKGNSKKASTWANDEETPRSVVDNDDELQQQIVEPITYRKRESKDSLELKANCFTMQTHVIMFNFAWYVYYYGTSKLDNFRPKENPLPFEFKIAAHVKCEITDTQALVVDCSDRIIVTFKGTTSMRNLKTSLRMSHERLQNVVRTSVYGEDETARLKRLFGRNYLNGKIHKGFAIAYKSVADEVMEIVRELRARRQRPVFLTGHSLGGALATICSLDLWVKLDVSRREIFVSTFGSPRVGNQDFAMVYKEVVPLHWRIVVDPDMVAKLPNVGYTHVGKKVVLTPHGEMIIDPSALEQRPWTGEPAGFAYHRKASYLLAMRAWCVRNHGMSYTPVFWPFPVRPEDRRRFAGAFTDVNQSSGRKVASKIIRMDAMVDALGRGDKELENLAVVEKWSRLTRRLLLSDKLTTAASG